jgi:trimethylamine:corrinoid methyltransferase-like protein
LYFPSDVIDRDTVEAWEKKGAKSAWERAKERVNTLLIQYQPSPMPTEVKNELRRITTKAARKAGMKELPALSFE